MRGGKISLGKAERLPKIGKIKNEFNANNFSDYGKNDRRQHQETAEQEMDFFLKYFPVRVRNVGEDAVAARKLIWAFKDARDNAFEKVAQMTAAHLIKVCGEKIKDIVFVCVPASTQAKNESRYMAFCNRVSELCGIINGYSHISVSGDRLAVHEHRHDKEKSITKTQVIEFDEAYFKGKDIYVFDDVVTTGASYAIFANQLEMFGGNVLGGLFLGRTHYKYAK